MPADRSNNNPRGKNGHGGAALDRWPQLPDLIADYVRRNIHGPDMIEDLRDAHDIYVSKSTIDRIKSKFSIPSVRRNPKSDVEVVASVHDFLAKNDPVGAMGTRDVKDRLANDPESSTFITTSLLRHVMKVADPDAQEKRHPHTKPVHRHGLYAAGPGEEWGFDQHEKLVPEMDIGVYGGVDKWSREPLAYFAVSRWKQRDVGAAVYVLAIQKKGGFPVTSVTDMGPETTDMCRISLSLREEHNPVLDIEQIPPHLHTNSRRNIYTEQKWKYIFRKDLDNVKTFFVRGKVRPTYNIVDPVHVALARWLWAQAVQRRLDWYVETRNRQKITKNKKVLLPTGVSPRQLASRPERYGGTNLLTPLPKDHIDRLVRDYCPHDVFQFGTDEEVAIFNDVFVTLSCEPVSWINAWDIYDAMIPHVRPRFI